MAKLVLIILDGWGIRKGTEKNAISKAKTPHMDNLLTHPNTILKASGEAVGLPKGTQGNSEVGHITLGSGRVVPQMLSRINSSIKDKSFFSNKAFLKAIRHCKKNKSILHIMGLIQDQGVHALSSHALSLLKLCKKHGVKTKFHAFTDGRDTHPKSARQFIKEVEKKADIATISGRFYAMDRDTRWSRTKKAYDCIMNGKGRKCRSSNTAINAAYRAGETDEFITPSVIGNYEGMKKEDAVIFFNFRYDRARQLTKAMTEKTFNKFKRGCRPLFVAMTPYYANIKAEVAFPEIIPKNVLGEVLSRRKLKQLRIAETEKYAHVTYFFNGQNEKPFKGEDRLLIKSTRKVRTYDKSPKMRAEKITKAVRRAIKKGKYDVIIVNYANADMVGHTGNFSATKKACEAIDSSIGEIITHRGEAEVIITADHGNAEDMRGKQQTSHTLNDVPFILVGRDVKLRKGGLADVAPTVLEILKIPKPKAMTGRSLIK